MRFPYLLESQVGHNVRLLTSVLISHQVWSEACDVEINIALADIGKKKTVIDAMPSLLDLSQLALDLNLLKTL